MLPPRTILLKFLGKSNDSGSVVPDKRTGTMWTLERAEGRCRLKSADGAVVFELAEQNLVDRVFFPGFVSASGRDVCVGEYHFASEKELLASLREMLQENEEGYPGLAAGKYRGYGWVYGVVGLIAVVLGAVGLYIMLFHWEDLPKETFKEQRFAAILILSPLPLGVGAYSIILAVLRFRRARYLADLAARSTPTPSQTPSPPVDLDAPAGPAR